MKVLHINHIGINVEDLQAAKAFFVALGFTVQGEMHMQGELVEKVIGLTGVSDDLVMLESPDKQMNIELVRYVTPKDPEGHRPNEANTLGYRHMAFEVEDLDTIVTELEKKDHKLMGEVMTYEHAWKLCYVRGPEGIIIELAEKLN